MLFRSLIIALSLLLGGTAFAQSVSVASPPPVCQPPNFLGANGTSWLCNTPATGPAVTVTGGSGVAVAGGPAYTVSINFPVHTKTASYPLTAADVSETLVYNSATPGTFTLLQASAVNGTAICFASRGVGPLTLAMTTGTTSLLYGGPLTLNKDQSECAQVDDLGNWLIQTGVSPVIANPNAFQ